MIFDKLVLCDGVPPAERGRASPRACVSAGREAEKNADLSVILDAGIRASFLQEHFVLVRILPMSRRLEYHTRTGLTLSQSQPVGTDPNWIPNTDVYESENHSRIFVVMELAGVDLERLEITLKGRLLQVRGERPDPSRTHKREFQQMEIDYGHFARRVRVGSNITASKASARFEHGFLIIELPKAPADAPKPATQDELKIAIETR
jgi:HSP20 family molecular chaperone IbpA